MNQEHPHIDTSLEGHHDRPYWKRAHHDWKFWVATLLMLAAMAIFVASNGFFVWPHRVPQTSIPK